MLGIKGTVSARDEMLLIRAMPYVYAGAGAIYLSYKKSDVCMVCLVQA